MNDTRIYFQSQPILPLNQTATVKNSQAVAKKNNNGASFQALLQQAAKQVNFSQYAINRMQSRGISLNEQELAKLDDTVEKLSKKGARESLIYLNDIALVVSIKNRTVITAMEGANGNDNIITNIDSAAII